MELKRIKGASLTAIMPPGQDGGEHAQSEHLQSADRLERYRNDWRLVFDKGLLVVQNPFSLRCESDEPVSMDSLIGCVVTDAYAMQDLFTLIFEANLVFSVSLKEEDYASPAAAAFFAPTGEMLFELKPDPAAL